MSLRGAEAEEAAGKVRAALAAYGGAPVTLTRDLLPCLRAGFSP